MKPVSKLSISLLSTKGCDMLAQRTEAVAVSQPDMDAAAEEQMQISLQRNNEIALQLRIAVRP